MVNGIQLTTMKEMDQCPLSVRASPRIVPTIASNPVSKSAHGKNSNNIEEYKRWVKLRLAEHPNIFHAKNNSATLWCAACMDEVNAKKSGADFHLATAKHAMNVTKNEKHLASLKQQRDFIKEYFVRTNAQSGTLNLETLQFRFSVLRSFLETGTPLNKIDGFRPTFERCAHLKLTYFGVIFRFVDPNDFKIQERLVALKRYQHGFNHQELISAIIQVLTQYNIQFGAKQLGVVKRRGQVLSFQRDRCSVNELAIDMLTRNCIGAKDMKCLAHTLVHPGEHLEIPILKAVKQDLCALMKDSYKCSTHWATIFGVYFQHPGKTRWWATYDRVYAVIYERFDDFYTFITTAVADGDVGESGARIQRLLEAVNNVTKRAWLKLEVAATTIVMKPLIQATYTLEGRGPCSLIAYEILKSLESWFCVHTPTLSYPGLQKSIIECIETLKSVEGAQNGIEELVTQRVRSILDPAIQYFNSRIFGMLSDDVAIYKTLRLVNPVAARKLSMTKLLTEKMFVDSVKSLNHFSDEEISSMCEDLHNYVAALDDVPDNVLPDAEMAFAISFWDAHRHLLSGLQNLVEYAFAIVPSSASVERVFSILKRCFGNGQRLALEDYSTLSCMLQKNRKDLGDDISDLRYEVD
jgi:hypothetical protein